MNIKRGIHTISLTVCDDHGVWSQADRIRIIVHDRPISEIVAISPDPSILEETVRFHGKGTDDGHIVNFSWWSSIDGIIHQGSEEAFAASNLSLGTHVIEFRVCDDLGNWSEPATGFLTVHRRPIGSIRSISPDPAFELSVITFLAQGLDDGKGY